MAPRSAPRRRHTLGQRARLLRYDAATLFYRSPLYRLALRGGGAGEPRPCAPDTWPGDGQRGAAVALGMFAFAGQALYNPAPFWAPPGALPAWLEEMHGFAWLRDLQATQDEAGREAARRLVLRWIDDNARWQPLAWHPDVIGRRLANWLGLYGFYADAEVAGKLLVSVRRQARHLARVLPGPLTGSALIAAIKGLAYAGLALPDGEALVRQALDLLQVELGSQFLPDGGHRERSPSTHVAALRDLVDLRTALGAGAYTLPAGLQSAIEELAPVVRMLRHGDGGLALFNDSDEDEAWRIDAVLARANGRAKTTNEALDTGFQRLAVNRTLVLVDSGGPPPRGCDFRQHAGTLSFEMSVGRERLVVNCGAHSSDPSWRQAQRSTAAHSTLVVDDTNSATLASDGGIERGPRRVSCRRQEAEGSFWLDLSHDGYREQFGLEHRRRLYLAASGDELRGEDRIVGSAPRRFAVRFHLHPDVQASLTQNRQGGLLRLPNGGGWRMRAIGGEVSIEDSVYLGRAGQMRRSRQIVVAVERPEPGAAVKWVFAREERAKR